MPDEETPAPEVPAFEEYPCSLGTVVAHEAGSYHIRLPDGRVTGLLANVEPSPENVEADIASPASPVAPVPQEVTRYQMRRALNATGLRSTVEAAVSAADIDTRDGWESATVVRRDNPLISAMAAGLGLTSEQIDGLFRTAASFE